MNRLKKSTTSFLVLLLFVSNSFFSAATDFYVSPAGNNKNPGTKEKPFATLQKAKSVIENMIKAQKESAFTIRLTGGTYHISEPLVFNSEFFNDGIEIEIAAENNVKPVISGGKKITGWEKNKNGLWETHLGEFDNNFIFNELFINNKRAIRARYPNSGFLRIKETGSDHRTNFYFNKEDFPIPEKVNGVELIFMHDWSISRIAVKSIDPLENKLTAVDSIGARKPSFFTIDNWEPHPRYFLENAIEFLDTDYEWFFDRDNRIVYLKLPENINPNNQQITIPVARSLIKIEGTKELPASGIHFNNIGFKHCAWQIPEKGYCAAQACFHDSRRFPEKKGWSAVPAAVTVEWAENCSFENCTFENLGTSGLWITTGTKLCSVKNSLFSDISGNGIMIGEGHSRYIDGEMWWKKVPEETATANTIEGCTVTDCGTRFFGAVGIWCGITAETKILNNEVYNLPYSGISIGWEWSPAETPCRANIVDGNHIHHIMKKLSDGGGIYMLGLQPGSRLTNNHIHDVTINAGRAESNGMFLDEGTTDVIIANNLIYNIAMSPLRFHRATVNIVKNNIFFCSNGHPPVRYNRTNEDDIKMTGNSFYCDKKDYAAKLKEILKNRDIKQ